MTPPTTISRVQQVKSKQWQWQSQGIVRSLKLFPGWYYDDTEFLERPQSNQDCATKVLNMFKIYVAIACKLTAGKTSPGLAKDLTASCKIDPR